MMRDSQRSRVYRAERAVPWGSCGRPLTGPEFCQWIQVLVNAPYVQALVPPPRARPDGTPASSLIPPIRVKVGGRKRFGAAASYYPEPRITCSLSSARAWVAVHELAHHVTRLQIDRQKRQDPGHGPLFCRNYLEIVRGAFGHWLAVRLEQEFGSFRVHVALATSVPRGAVVA